MLVKELLNQPLLKHPYFSPRYEGESSMEWIDRLRRETNELIDSLVDEYEKDMNSTTAGNLCLQLLLIGNNDQYREHMIEAMQRALKTTKSKNIVMVTDEWLLWARSLRDYMMNSQIEKERK